MKLLYLSILTLLLHVSFVQGQDMLIRNIANSACSQLDSLDHLRQLTARNITHQLFKHLQGRTGEMMRYYEQEKTARPELTPYEYGNEIMFNVMLLMVDSCDVYFGYHDTLMHHTIGRFSSAELSRKVDSINQSLGPDTAFSLLINAFILSELGRHDEAVISIQRMLALAPEPENRILAAVLMRKKRERDGYR